MLKKIKMKLCYATIPMILGAYLQPVHATETMTLQSNADDSKPLFSQRPSQTSIPMHDLRDDEALLNWAKSFTSAARSSDPLPNVDSTTHTKWIEGLTASIDARAKEIMTVSTERNHLTRKIEDKNKERAKLYAREDGLKITRSQQKKRGPLTKEINNLETQLQGVQIKLAKLELQQEFDYSLRHKIGEYRVYARVSDFFGDSTLGKFIKFPALFGVSMIGPMLNDMPRFEKMKEAQKEDSDTLSTVKESMDNVITALLIGGSIALNHGVRDNPYLTASVIFASLYNECGAIKRVADQVVRSYLGSEISPKAAERLAWAIAIGYAIYYAPGAAAFPYAAPGPEKQLYPQTNIGVGVTSSGNTGFAITINSTNADGIYFDQTLTPTSSEYPISLSTLPVSGSAPKAIILSDGVSTIAGYQIAANSGDMVLRAGNETHGFSGPEVTLTPTAGVQNAVSLIPLPNNNKFVALIQTNPTGSNADVIGYTYAYNATSNVMTLVQGPYAGNTVTTGDQGNPSGALYGNGDVGFIYQGTQSGTDKQYAVVLNPTTGANVVADYALHPTGGVQAGGVCTSLQNGEVANAWVDGSTLQTAVTTSGGVAGTVTQFNNAGVTVLNSNKPIFITGTADGNWAVEYSAQPVVPGNQEAYYSVGNPSGNALSKDTPIPTSTNAQVASGIVGLQGSNLGATFVGSSGANLPGLIGTPIDNTAATTAPTTAPVGTPTTTPSGGTTAPVGTPTTTPSGGTTAPVGTPTTTPTHSGANSLQPPFALFYKGVAAAIGTGVNMARWAIGK